jgi:hypothetical protein
MLIIIIIIVNHHHLHHHHHYYQQYRDLYYLIGAISPCSSNLLFLSL